MSQVEEMTLTTGYEESKKLLAEITAFFKVNLVFLDSKRFTFKKDLQAELKNKLKLIRI
jgi:hypothetical protein